MFNLSKTVSKFYSPCVRSIFLSSVQLNRDLYSVLGVKQSATQAEIKGAYYNLSLKLHPDRNKGSDDAAEQFRLVTDAYEVLGNIKLRKLYDRGALHKQPSGASAPPPQPPEPEEPLDKDTKQRFYSAYAKYSRARQAPSATFAGQVYNFDEWTRAHYTSSFKAAKVNLKEKDGHYSAVTYIKTQHHMLYFGFILMTAAVAAIVHVQNSEIEENAINFKGPNPRIGP
ncbi:unnamed protein product [Bemisia tabaci]|uniref:J domain-containing protein n=1 Tax=Bemisia tabaci TaxID=7038 RepID=A0A9P0A406_BEMTA|nr:PREDICTED: dnaJ homolog subfamily C member 30-like [Bemisia tabaci]CAH0385878.1 unnamed protein product [Bemisia tabaci]